VAGGNGAGSSADKLSGPWGIYVDSSNSVYIVDRNNHRVQRWNLGKYYLLCNQIFLIGWMYYL
jgi:hypothetical protein